MIEWRGSLIPNRRPHAGLPSASWLAKERDILERAVKAVTEQAAKADELVDEAIAAGLDDSHPVTIHAKCRDWNS